MNYKLYIKHGQTALWVGLIMLFALPAIAQIPSYYRQAARNNEGSILTANILFGGHLTAANMADRFGDHVSTGLGADYVSPNDWIVGVQWNFYFGSKVKEDVVSNLRSSDGLIFGDNGDLATVALRQRGIYLGAHMGKIFRLKASKRSGIRATVGAGILQHKVRIQDDAVVAIPQLNKTYKKGYDRLTNGLSFTEFIGYQHLGDLRRGNFTAGIELTQGFTQNRRNLNFDTRTEDNASRLDLILGFRIEWLLPFYLGENADEIRY